MSGSGSQGAVGYRSPVKHSVTIAGHETAITLEPIFWTALRNAAQARSLPLNALVARIDVERIATADPPNLASAIRQWLMAEAQMTQVGRESPTSHP
ncbi:MAG: aryl-sulfate sulfotransferase [Sphingomonadales bacterium]|nr:aryl-sulfate sulfotransferase [Sphingomonadales bacterium]